MFYNVNSLIVKCLVAGLCGRVVVLSYRFELK